MFSSTKWPNRTHPTHCCEDHMKNTYFKLLAQQGPAASETHGVWADREGLAGSCQDSVMVMSAKRIIQVAMLRMGWLGQGWGQADQGAG